MNNSNLEFRKIPSLLYLYEVNENGTIFRNVKSKKQLKIKLDMHHSKIGYYATFVCIKNKVRRVMIHTVVAECWLGVRPEGYEIDHIDRNSRNNDYRNLRYVNHSLQMKNRTLSEATYKRVRQNCMAYTMKEVAVPIEIRNTTTGAVNVFPSMTECAKYIATLYAKTTEHVRWKLKKRRKVIYDFEVVYLRNAQTGRVGSTEQGTVDLKECI